MSSLKDRKLKINYDYQNMASREDAYLVRDVDLAVAEYRDFLKRGIPYAKDSATKTMITCQIIRLNEIFGGEDTDAKP